MTYKNLQDRVLDRLNLTTTDARDRIKDFLNERLRTLQTTVNLAKVRRGTVRFSTTTSEKLLSLDTGGAMGDEVIIKPFTIVSVAHNRELRVRTQQWMRNTLVARQGEPTDWCVSTMNATTTVIELYPEPDGAYDLDIDGLLPGTDLSSDSDVPAFPEDYHDILIKGAMADENDHLRDEPNALVWERKWEKRLGELRYFIAKEIRLSKGNGLRSPNVLWWRI